MMRQRGWQARLQRASVFSAWPRLVGPEVARHAVPLRVRGDVLVVATSHQAWAAQLSFLRTELVRRLRAECGDKLRDIVFEVQWDLLQSLRDPPSEPPAPPNAGALPRRADGAVDVGSAFAAWHLAAQRRRARLPGSERTRADV